MKRMLVPLLVVLSITLAANFQASGETVGAGKAAPKSGSLVKLDRIKPPADFKITYFSGPVHADWGTTTIVSLKADGQGTVTIKRGRMAQRRGKPAVQNKNFQMDQEAVQRIYAQVVACNFFQLKDEPTKMRGGWSSILDVTAQGQQNSIRHNPRTAKLAGIVMQETKKFRE